ncbi:class I SAM-dependent methyltransferase [Synechocystis sp. LKSZ1]|uniref:class I SAM-dependent methyltransferase n=1 Tax=Synechocystis sp. LKSZ1 TaxID=3144951 RepID=UPI00336BEAA8
MSISPRSSFCLRAEDRTKLDNSDDTAFYAYPRFVTHVDAHFIDQLTQLYRERLRPHSRVLDLMSSWVSHLPTDMDFAWVEGHGLNAEELAKNPRLNHYFVQNLNQNLQLPLPDQDFDAVLITVSVQYLQYPEAIFSEVYRVLKPGGQLIVSFSNRMFYQKAIAAWREGTDAHHLQLVKAYCQSVAGFSAPEVVIKTATPLPGLLQLLGMAGPDPFYAVMTSKLAENAKA